MIYDIIQVIQFEGLFIHPHNENEATIVYVAARKKYDSSLASNIGSMNRTIVTKKDKLEDIVNSLNTKYFLDNKMLIDEKALAVYMSINPRNTHKSASTLAKHIIDSLYENKTIDYYKIPSKFKTILQSTSTNKIYTVLDVDNKTYYNNVLDILEIYSIVPYCIIETRGGYHFIIKHENLSNIRKKTDITNKCICSNKIRCEHIMTFGEYIHKIMITWRHTDAPDKAVIEYLRDGFSPIPGTIQGGFKVKLLYPIYILTT